MLRFIVRTQDASMAVNVSGANANVEHATIDAFVPNLEMFLREGEAKKWTYTERQVVGVELIEPKDEHQPLCTCKVVELEDGSKQHYPAIVLCEWHDRTERLKFDKLRRRFEALKAYIDRLDEPLETRVRLDLARKAKAAADAGWS